MNHNRLSCWSLGVAALISAGVLGSRSAAHNPSSDLAGSLTRFEFSDGSVREVVPVNWTRRWEDPVFLRGSSEELVRTESRFDASALGWSTPLSGGPGHSTTLYLVWQSPTNGVFEGVNSVWDGITPKRTERVSGSFVVVRPPRSAPSLRPWFVDDSNVVTTIPHFTDAEGNLLSSLFADPSLDVVGISFRAYEHALQVPAGSSIEVRAQFQGQMPMWQQWYHNGIPVGQPAQLEPLGAQFSHNFGTGVVQLQTGLARLRLDSLTLEDGGSYEVVVSNETAAVPSFWPARLSVGPLIEPPRISKIPGDAVVLPYSLATDLVVEAEGEDLRYQWFKGHQALIDEDEPVLRLMWDLTDGRERGTLKDGEYHVRVSNGQGTVMSDSIEVTLGGYDRYPRVSTSPEHSRLVTEGGTAEFKVIYNGDGSPIARWSHNGRELPEFAGKDLRIENANIADRGFYYLHIINRGLTSNTLVHLDVAGLPLRPEFLSGPGPAELRLAVGSPIELKAHTRNVDDKYFGGRLQWYRNGVPLEGKTGPVLQIWESTEADAGTYTVRAWSPRFPDFEAVSPATDVILLPRSRLTNLSTRAWVGSGDRTLIGGVVIVDGPARILARGLGPMLEELGVTGALPDPRIAVYDTTGKLIAENDNWHQSAVAGDIEAAASIVGARALQRGSGDAALLLDLPAGAHTFHVMNKPGQKGISMVEVFLVPGSGLNGRLSNLSARAFSQPGDRRVIAGMVLEGTVPTPFLVRAVSAIHLDLLREILPDPRFDVFEGSKIVASDSALAHINEWETLHPRLESLFARLGASPTYLESDPAAVVTFRPGPSTVHVYDESDVPGFVVVEIFDTQP